MWVFLIIYGLLILTQNVYIVPWKYPKLFLSQKNKNKKSKQQLKLEIKKSKLKNN